MPLIDSAKLTGIARRVFAAAGSDEAEAAIVADHLVEANLKGTALAIEERASLEAGPNRCAVAG